MKPHVTHIDTDSYPNIQTYSVSRNSYKHLYEHLNVHSYTPKILPTRRKVSTLFPPHGYGTISRPWQRRLPWEQNSPPDEASRPCQVCWTWSWQASDNFTYRIIQSYFSKKEIRDSYRNVPAQVHVELFFENADSLSAREVSHLKAWRQVWTHATSAWLRSKWSRNQFSIWWLGGAWKNPSEKYV